MQRYNINNRLAYLSGGVQSAGGMWPSAAAGDWWDVAGETCVAAYAAKGAASEAASYVNLANPGTYDLSETGSVGWTSGAGWTFVSGAYLSFAGTVGGTGYTWIVRFNVTDSGGGSAGRAMEANGARLVLIPSNTASGNNLRTYGNNNAGFSQVTVTGALSGANVMAMADGTAYLNGSAETGSMSTGPADSYTVYIGNRSDGARWLGGSMQALAVYSTTLDASQISSLTTAMNAL